MKTDARVRYTKKVLRESLLSLMKSKPIKEITVKEVCEAAELNRATFYKHYRDCYDLLENIENELIEDFAVSLKLVDSFEVTDLVTAIFDMIERNLELCRLLIFEHTDDTIIQKMIAISHDVSIENWRPQLKKATEAELELLFTCLANGLMHVVLEGYQKYDKGQLISFVNTTVHSCVAAYM